MEGKPVAYFEVRLAGGDVNETQETIQIAGNEQFYLGRNSTLCRHHWLDPTISNKHLRIHCVLYEQDPVAGIPPFVYATDLSINGTHLKKSNAASADSQDYGILMGRRHGAFLLDHGDELRLSDFVTLVYNSREKIEQKEASITPLQLKETTLFGSRYLVTERVLGVGGYGKVMVGVHQATKRQLACKVIDVAHLSLLLSQSTVRLSTGEHRTAKKKRWPSRLAKYFREFDIPKDLDHPNIIAIEKVFWSTSTIYIFQELVTGGDLFSYIEYKGGKLRDIEAAVVVRQILKGIEYLHRNDIVHRDLKPDNILMTSLDDGARVVITDFGNARFLPKPQSLGNHPESLKHRMFSMAGTLEFTAPEIHKVNPTMPQEQGYSKSVDMWSIGSITAALLTGDVIFTDRGHPSYEANPKGVILSLARKCDLSRLDDEYDLAWAVVGSRPKDFIKRLLVLREENRLTATEALAHSWFSNECHAAEFEALYSRAVRDWQPRRKVFQLVEQIMDRSTAGALNDIISQDAVSRVFTPSQKTTASQGNYETPRHLAAGWRRNSPLLAITEEHEGASFDGPASLMQQSVRRSSTRQDAIGNSMDKLRLEPENQDMYEMDESDYEYYGLDQDPELDQDAQLSREATADHDAQARTPPQADTDSIVYETPVRTARKHFRSPVREIPSYASLVGEQKRRKISKEAR
ncbi:kinase-like domain-containing protein [Massariosphaeria phaeospora]|uniref:Kinase-like domain-containing protein n=1 Tax=Massariosphaeria phaeospora TaxID=100035 RepID=A0A7C8I1R1_9PLEO|nr:kinase-like domain-containing protein [Massariosphaeria phaeospora]